MLLLQGWTWREMKYSKGLSNLLQNKNHRLWERSRRKEKRKAASSRGMIGKVSPVAQRGTQGEWLSPSVVRWGGLALEGSANTVWDMPSPRCCWNIQMDMQIRQFDQWAQSQWNRHCEAVSMEKSTRHWETATVPEHQSTEDGAGWRHNVTAQI